MKISQKLLVIVCLTILEVSITVWATFQISKGATLHQLNSLHLKHNHAFSKLVADAKTASDIDTLELERAIDSIRDQPIAGREIVGPLDRLVMQMIDTDRALDLIDKDINDADVALEALDEYRSGELTSEELLSALCGAAGQFHINSSRFEEPIAKTVTFMLKMMIPMIIALSLFNICFISYLSRSITSSIRSLIQLLKSGPIDPNHMVQFSNQVSGELGELMKVAEERLRVELMSIESNQELRVLIDQRTESLRSAREHAEAALAVKERFLANMSHEIRTPINGILCASELVLQELEESDPHYEFNAIIHDSATSLLRILNDVLDLSKIESGKLSVESAPFDLPRTVSQVVALMTPQAEQRGLSFEASAKLEAASPWVEGDAARLRQILINLVGNSLKFTESGTVRLDFVLSETEGDDLMLKMSVSDTGIGMSEDHLARLFDRFVQADESTTRKYGGTGLGMSVSLELVQLMGGELNVESELGRGTTFNIALPLSKCDLDQQPAKAPRDLTRDYGGVRVLLAEDNPVNQRVASALLTRLGLDVIVAEDGAAAVELASDELALVLMDVQMPVMDGLEATAELIARGVKAPIVALSANVFDEDRARYSDAGMQDFVAKPIESARLVEVLDRYLECRVSRAA